jgi:hypothetical protein
MIGLISINYKHVPVEIRQVYSQLIYRINLQMHLIQEKVMYQKFWGEFHHIKF